MLPGVQERLTVFVSAFSQAVFETRFKGREWQINANALLAGAPFMHEQSIETIVDARSVALVGRRPHYSCCCLIDSSLFSLAMVEETISNGGCQCQDRPRADVGQIDLWHGHS